MLTEIPYYHSFYALQNLKKPTDPICSCHAFFLYQRNQGSESVNLPQLCPLCLLCFLYPEKHSPHFPKRENNEKKRNNKECHLNKTLQHSVREQYWGLFHVPQEVAACFIYAKLHLSCFSETTQVEERHKKLKNLQN